jgi:hypothetical protein
LQHHRSKPKLGYVTVSLNINVLRFIPVTGIEEEPTRS